MPSDAETKAAMELQAPVATTAPLTFDAKTHTYRLDGVVVPSVTQVLSEAGLLDAQWYTDQHSLRGRIVHVITALDDRNALDESQVGDEYLGYLVAWRAFRTSVPWTILDIEQAVYHAAYRFAGRYDRRMCIHEDGPYAMLVEIKTGQPEQWHRLQTAAYLRCSLTVRSPVVERYVVYLRNNGTYKVCKHDDASDWDVFLAALALANWKRNEGKTNDRDRD